MLKCDTPFTQPLTYVLAHWKLSSNIKLTLSHTPRTGISAKICFPDGAVKQLHQSQIRGFTGVSQYDKAVLRDFVATTPSHKIMPLLVKENTELILFPRLNAAGTYDQKPPLNSAFVDAFNDENTKRSEYLIYAIANFQELQDTGGLTNGTPNPSEISNVRAGFMHLIRCKDIRIQSLTLNELIVSLEMGPFDMAEVEGLLDLSEQIMQELEVMAVHKHPTYLQEKLIVAYGLVLENLHFHYAEGNFGKVHEEKKRALVKQTEQLSKLTKKDNLSLKFAIAYANEGVKRLKTDVSQIKKWATLGYHIGRAAWAGYGMDVLGSIESLVTIYKTAKGMDITRDWYDRVSTLRKLGRLLRTQPDLMDKTEELIAFKSSNILSMVDPSSWYYGFGVVTVLGDVAQKSTDSVVQKRTVSLLNTFSEAKSWQVRYWTVAQWDRLCQSELMSEQLIPQKESALSKEKKHEKILQLLRQQEILRLTESQWQTDIATIQKSLAQELPSVWNVPSRNWRFVGRNRALLDIEKVFQTHKRGIVTSAAQQTISGLGGIGKTQLVKEYAYLHAQNYRFVWWIRAENSTTMDNDLVNLAKALKLSVHDKQEDTIAELVGYLSKNDGWLLIYDNVEEDNEPQIPQGNGQVLMTTRSQEVGEVDEQFQLATFDRAESIELLSQGKDTQESDAPELNTLAEQLGDLPLALEQASAYMRQSRMPVSKYLQFFEKHRTQLWRNESIKRKPTELYPTTVAKTWETSIFKIKEHSTFAANMLIAMSFLSADGIPKDLIEEIMGAWVIEHYSESSTDGDNVFKLDDSETHLDDIGSEHNLDISLEFYNGLRLLLGYSMIREDIESEMLSVHRLVQMVSRDAIDTEMQKKWIKVVLGVLKIRMDHFDNNDHTTWQPVIAISDHAVAIANLANAQSIDQETVAKIYVSACNIQITQNNFDRAKIYCKQAKDRYIAAFGTEDHLEVAKIYNLLGNITQLEPKYLEKSKEMHEKALAIQKRVLGTEDHLDVAMSYNNLGNVLIKQQKFLEAKIQHEKVLAIRQRILGTEDHLDLAMSYNNLGKVSYKLGKFSESIDMYKKSIETRKRVLGTENNYEISTYYLNLGDSYMAQKKYSEAKNMYESALAIRKVVFGTENHVEVLIMYENLGFLLSKQEKYEDSKAHFEKQLAISKILCDNDQETLVSNSYNNLGALFYAQKNYVLAKEYYEKSLQSAISVLGTEIDLSVAGCYFNLGLVLDHQGNGEEARIYYEKDLSITKEIFGTEDHLSIAATYESLGELLLFQKKYNESEHMLEKALSIRKRLLGTEMHPDIAKNYKILGIMFMAQKEFSQATEMLEKALAIYSTFFDDDDQNIQICKNRIQRIAVLLENNEEKNGCCVIS